MYQNVRFLETEDMANVGPHTTVQADEEKSLGQRVAGVFDGRGDVEMGQSFLLRLTVIAVGLAVVVLAAAVMWAA